MANRESANILFVFALGISFCLLYSTEFASFREDKTFGGLMCKASDTVFSALSVLSIIQCAFQCSLYDACVAVFNKPSEKKCVGCLTSSKEDMETEDEYIGYLLDKGCGTPPSIAYGLLTPYPGSNTAALTCDPRFRPSSDTVRCTPNGSWETATCDEYDCYLTTPWEYRGKRNATFSRPCLRWDSHLLVTYCLIWYCPKPQNEAEDYCRNPDPRFDKSPYCIPADVTADTIHTETCNISKC